MKIKHLDLISNPHESLIKFDSDLEDLLHKKNKIEEVPEPKILSLIDDIEYSIKASELLGHTQSFAVATIAPNFSSNQKAPAAEHIAKTLGKEIELSKSQSKTKIFIPNRNIELEFTSNGIIDKSNFSYLVGCDAMHALACNVLQDMGLLLKQKESFIYAADFSRFEKTPKDVRTGKNNYIGMDLLEFHGKAKNFGHILPKILGNIASCFEQHKLDMVTIDLRGLNTYSNGLQTLRRFERDHALPIFKDEKMKGIIVYANVIFQPQTELRNPYEGGRVIKVGSEIHNYHHLPIKVMPHGN